MSPSSTQASTTLSTYGTPAINLTTAPYSVPYSVPYSGPYSGPAYSPASLPSLLSGNSLGVTYSPQPLATVIGGIGVNPDLKPFPLGPDASPFFSFADLISALDIESLVHTLTSSLRGTKGTVQSFRFWDSLNSSEFYNRYSDFPTESSLEHMLISTRWNSHWNNKLSTIVRHDTGAYNGVQPIELLNLLPLTVSVLREGFQSLLPEQSFSAAKTTSSTSSEHALSPFQVYSISSIACSSDTTLVSQRVRARDGGDIRRIPYEKLYELVQYVNNGGKEKTTSKKFTSSGELRQTIKTRLKQTLAKLLSGKTTLRFLLRSFLTKVTSG